VAINLREEKKRKCLDEKNKKVTEKKETTQVKERNTEREREREREREIMHVRLGVRDWEK